MATTQTHRPKPRKRPHFAPAQQLSADRLNGIMEEELRRTRLLMRALHGHGVVFGYSLKMNGECLALTDHCLDIGCGLILDRHGRELFWPGGRLCIECLVGRKAFRDRKPGARPTHGDEHKPEPPPDQEREDEPQQEPGYEPSSQQEGEAYRQDETRQTAPDTYRRGEEPAQDGGKGSSAPEPDQETPEEERADCGWYLLRAHYAERRDPPDRCGPCPAGEKQWLEQTVLFSLCEGCEEAGWGCPELEGCVSLRDYVCARTGSTETGKVARAADLEWACEEPGPLCEADCGGWAYDPAAGVPIACVRVCRLTPQDADCEPRYGFCPDKPEACSVRPYVYRTPLLFELARDCHIDLARVKSLSWQDWILRDWDDAVPWREFADRLNSDRHAFTVEFTKPIAVRTMHQASLFLTAVVKDRDRLWKPSRIPLETIEPLDVEDGYATRVALVVDSNWVRRETEEDPGYCLHERSLIELSIRGQLLRDECGRMLDARPIQGRPGDSRDPRLLDPAWLGQARPGGDFIAVFRVGLRREEHYSQARGDQSARQETQWRT